MQAVDVEETINAVHDPGRVIHNLPPLRSVVARKSEFGRLLDFLRMNDDHEDEFEIAHPPPALMVVSGPKGFGKTTLTLQAAYRGRQYGDFKTIIWFNKQRFLEILLSEGDSVIPPNGPSRLRDEVDEAVREFLAEPQNQQRLEVLKDFAKQTQAVSEERRPSRRFVDRFLAAAYPYLLIIDDIDEDFYERTPQICQELMRVRAPNKVILTSRTPNLPFGYEVNITPLRLGLLNSYQVDHLVRCMCDRDGLARQYWINENIDDTIQWTWANLGGLADVIVHVFGKAKEESKPLDHSSYWSGILRAYALSYLGDGTAKTADEVFGNLSPAEKYILTTLAWSAPVGPISRKNLILLIAIHESHPQLYDYSDSITSLYAKRFLGYEVASAISDELYQLHPFMHSVIQDNLEIYWKDDFQRERTARLVEFFGHYARTREGLTFLANYVDQGLTALSWLGDQEDWAEALKFGETLVDVLLLSDGAKRDTDIIEACQRMIAAAEAIENGNAEAEYRIILLKFARASGAAELYLKQSESLIKFREAYGELEEDIQNALAPVYLHLALRNHNVEEARQWLDKTNGTDEMGHQARLELAEYFYSSAQYLEALREAKLLKEQRQLRESYTEVDIQAHQLLAIIYYKLNELDKSMTAYTEAAMIAKSLVRPDLANDYLKAAEFIKMSTTSTPLDKIGLPHKTLYWPGIETEQNCPLCHQEFIPLEEESRRTWICPGCLAKFHQDCIVELKISACPLCRTPIPEFDSPIRTKVVTQ